MQITLAFARSTDCLNAGWIEKLIDGLIEKSNVQNFNINELDLSNFHSPLHLGDKKNRKYCVLCWKKNKIQCKTYFKCDIC